MLQLLPQHLLIGNNGMMTIVGVYLPVLQGSFTQ